MNPGRSAPHARQFKRHNARLAARIEPHSEHADQFRLSFPDAQSDLAVVDVSQGGLGLITGVMLPKNLRLIIRIDASEATSGQTFVLRAIVRRCVQLDHKPTFQMGLQFLDAGGADERGLVRAVSVDRALKPAGAGAEPHDA